MIFVTDAGYQGIVALSACSTLPVSASTTSSASACTIRGATIASAARRTIQHDDDLQGNGGGRCTIRFRSFETSLQRGGLMKRRPWRVKACPAPPVVAGTNLYRLIGPEQRLCD